MNPPCICPPLAAAAAAPLALATHVIPMPSLVPTIADVMPSPPSPLQSHRTRRKRPAKIAFLASFLPLSASRGFVHGKTAETVRVPFRISLCASCPLPSSQTDVLHDSLSPRFAGAGTGHGQSRAKEEPCCVCVCV